MFPAEVRAHFCLPRWRLKLAEAFVFQYILYHIPICCVKSLFFFLIFFTRLRTVTALVITQV